MIWTQKNLMFRFYNATKKQWELDYEEKGWLQLWNYDEITSICNAFPDKWDVIEVDQYLNVEDTNKKKRTLLFFYYNNKCTIKIEK